MLFWTSIEIDLQDLPKMLLQFINFIYKNTVPLQQDMILVRSESAKTFYFSFSVYFLS